MRRTHRGVGVAGNGNHTDPHSVPRDTQDGLTLGQGSDAVLTHVSVARPLFKSMVYEHRKYVVGGGGSRQYQTHTNTHTHNVTRDTQGGWSLGKDRTQS